MKSIRLSAPTASLIRLTVYAGAHDPVPIAQDDLSWPELVSELDGAASLIASPEKEGLTAFSPVRLNKPHRKAANVEHVTALFIDVDRANLPAIEGAINSLGIAAVVYGSPSDDPGSEVRRVRIVAPVDRVIKPDECRATRIAFAEVLGLEPGCGVEGAIDPAKIFFVGRVEGTAERYFRHFDGEPVPVDTLLATPLKFEWGGKRSTTSTPLAELPPAEAGIVAALGHPRDHAGRKWEMLGHVGGLMRKQGFTAEQCEAVVREWLAPIAGTTCNVGNGVKRALEAWALDPDACTGFQALAEVIGAEHAEVVSRATFNAAQPGLAAYAQRAAARSAAAANDAGAITATDSGAAAYHVPEPDGLFGTRARGLFSEPELPLEYLCKGLALASSDGKISLIAGDPGGGKGPIADHLTLCFATGGKAFGEFKCEPANVLLLDCEGKRLTMRRIRRMARAVKVEPSSLDRTLHVFDASTFNLLEHGDQIAAYVHEHSIGVLVLDSYTSAMLGAGVDANQPEFAALAKLLGSLGILVIAVAHANKAAGVRGGELRLSDVAYSGAFAAMAQTAIVVSYPDRDDRNLIRVACARAPEGAFPTIGVRFEDAPGDALRVRLAPLGDAGAAKEQRRAEEHRDTVARRADSLEALLTSTYLGEGVTPTEAKRALSMNGEAFGEAVSECLRRGTVRRGPGPRKGTVTLEFVPPDQRTPERTVGRFRLPARSK